MPRKEVFNLTIDVGANISQAQSAAKSLQQAFSKINLTDSLKKGLDKTFGDLEKELNNFGQMTSKPFTNMKDVEKAEKSFEKINDLLNDLQVQGKTIAGMDLSKFLPDDTVNKLKSLNDQLKQVKQNQDKITKDKADLGKKYEEYNEKIRETERAIRDIKDIEKERSTKGLGLQQKDADNLIKYQNALKDLQEDQKKLNEEIEKTNKKKPDGLKELRQALSDITGIKIQNIPYNLDKIQNIINNLNDDAIEQVRNTLKDLGPLGEQVAQQLGLIEPVLEDTSQSAGELSEVAKEVQRLGEQVKQFFSIGNTIQLFKRAVRDAMATVKELDATMTETATVTDFSISDMWEQLPRYTDEANKLGTSINSLYKATTLYYQQGLQTEEAMALGIETIKMARVANMDAALATDLMTAALRGFNMELNEMSAVRINDVYSELAAVTAADTDEIGIAISKTASIAHSANMEFETTAAFLSQIIETTREAPETAGTAMKTIIARFSEVKKLYSEGQILGTDEEGEAINVNKIQEALRTVGIDMTKFFVGAEGLDDVLLRLAEKWDTLDVATQRYIATQAAGSRQQSRFLAMMSDYDRTMELVDAAYDSAGSGQAQFEKTLDSMQAKLTELKNAWDQFVMGLANNEILKFGVDTLTSILSTINDIISAISGGNGLVKSVLSLGSAFLALRGGAKLFGSSNKDGWIQKILGIAKKNETNNEIKKTSEQIGTEIGTHIGNGIDKSKNFIKDKINSFFTKENFGLEKTASAKDLTHATIQLPIEQRREVLTTFKTEGADAAIKKIEEFGGKVENTKIKVGDWSKTTKAAGEALIGLGTAITFIGSLVSKGNEELGDSITAIGQVVMAVGGVVALIPSVVSGIKAIASALNVASGPIGWVIAGITALISVFTILSQFTPEKQLERAEEKAKKSAQAAQEAQQAYDDLLSNRNNYNQLEDKVKSLTEGTREWTEAVRELNSAVLELTQKYEGLEIVVDSAGNLSITEESWNKVQKQQEKELREKQFTAGKDAIDREQKRVNVAKSNTKVTDNSGNTVTEIQYKENGEIDQDWIKSQGYVYAETVDLTEAEKGLEREYKNLITQFAAYVIDDKNQVNQVSAAMSTVLGDSIKDIKTPEEMEDKINEFYNKFSQLGETEQKVLGGQLTLIDFKSLDFDALGDEYKDEIEALEKELSNRLESTRQILSSRLFQGNRTETDNFINKYGAEISEKLGQHMQDMSPKQANQYLNTWEKIFEDKGKDIAEALLDFDVTDFRSLTNLTDYMHEQGFDKDDAEEYWRAMVNGAENFTVTYGQIASWAEGIKESMKGVTEMVERLESGKLTADDLTAFENAGLDTSNRLLTADGYKVFGVDSQEARRALNQANAEKAQRDLDTLNEVGSDIGRLGTQDQREIDHYAEMLSLTKQKDETEEEFVKRIQDEWARTREIAEETNDYAQAAIHTADEWAALGGTDKQIRYATMQEASDAGLDVDELITYSEKLKETYGLEQAIADRIALDNMKMNASIKELSSNWDEWKAGLEGGKDTAEYSAALNSLRKNMQSMLGITSNLSEEFLTNADNMDLMARAAEGDGDAIDELRKKAATEIALGVNYDEDGVDQLESDLITAINNLDIENIEIGASLDSTEFGQALQEMLNSAGLTVDQMEDILESLGFEPKIDYRTIPVDAISKDTSTGIATYTDPISGQVYTAKLDSVLTSDNGATVQFPIINGSATSFKGPSKSTVNGSNKKGGSGGKKGGGGGGGSSKKKDNWKNPYDKYYNLTEKINEALRTREKIERDYDRILKRRERTAAELLKNSAQEIANLRQEIVYQQRLQAGRREQIENLAKERYDNGDQRTTFEQMGVTKYANYNFDTQTIEIDWAAIEAVRDEELGKAIEAYVGRLEELQGQFEDTQTTIEDMEDTIWEINQRGKEEYLNFESRIIDALINADQKLIDDLSAKFDSINEVNSRVLSSMQESIDLERQIRDNTKTEDDIASKEARLAYLRRDTSGANQMEIMKLEQDLADARQNYSDQLIDQGMQKLSDENEKASQQRQEQIDIMQAIHDWTVESGGFNATAERLINETAAAGEVTEEVKKLLQDNEGWTSMTKFAGEDWMTKLANEYKAAMEGMSNFKVDDAKTKHTSANNTMSVIDEEGKNAADVWFDNTLQRWVDKSGNLYDIYWDATANEGKGAYRYSNKQAKDTTDPNAWLKDYFDKMIAALGDKDSGTPSSGSGGNGGSSGSSGPKPPTTSTDHGYTIQKGDGSKITKTGLSSKKAAQQAAEYKINNQIKAAQAAYDKTYQDYLKGKATTSSRNSALAFLNNWKWAKITNVYKTGGLNTQTGLAWLDGTASHPELVLNARDTENFIQLKDILSDMGSLDKLQNGGDNYYNFDIKVDQLANDYDVDKLIGKIKNEINKDATYRNVNAINLIR